MSRLVSLVILPIALILLFSDQSEAQRRRPTVVSPPAASSQESTRQSASENVRQTLPDDWMEFIKWRSIGPANMGGRITSIAVFEKDPCIWYVASASGGILKTVNNGQTFEHLFDDQATVSIGDVQVSQSDSDIVWVGTGEANPRNSVSWGDGVYKSTDGGTTWKNMGLKKSFQIGRIAIHPENPDIVYVGALGRLWGPSEERGLFKTTDGGKNWEKILFIDDKTGVIDVKLHPKDAETLLVATYERQRDGFDGNDPEKKYGDGSGLYRSADGGKTFEKMSAGLPGCKLGRIGLDWHRKNPDFVYAIIESEKIASVPENAGYAGLSGENADVGARITDVVEGSPAAKSGLKAGDIVIQVNGKFVYSYSEFLAALRRNVAGDEVDLLLSRDRIQEQVTITLGNRPRPRGREGRPRNSEFTGTLGGQAENLQGQQGGENEHEFGGVYMSRDAGVTWERINTLNPRPMYYSQVRVDPVKRDHLYVLGTSLYRSSDGGEKFNSDGGNGTHPDHHAMWIDPRDGRHMILGNDGGIYVTWDRMDTWEHLNKVAIGQFYHVGIDHTRDFKAYGGLQDNGSWGGPAQNGNGGPGNTDWFRVGGGDGFITHVDPTDADQIYFESQNGAMGRVNFRTGDRGFIRPQPPRGTRYRFNWKTPFILSPHNPQIHYSAGNYVFRSISKGDNVEAISPEITNTVKGAGSAISESPVTAGVVYVGTTDGAVWVTRDGGQKWEEIFVQKEKGGEEEEQEVESESSSTPDSDSMDHVAADAAKLSTTGRGTITRLAGFVSMAIQEDDPVSGVWKARMLADEIPAGQGEFTLELKLNDDHTIEGRAQSPMGEIDIDEGTWSADSGEFKFQVSSEEAGFDAEVTGSIRDGKMSGEIVGGDGQFRVDFEALREEPTEDEPAEMTEAGGDEPETSGDEPKTSGDEPKTTEAESGEAKQTEETPQEESTESDKPVIAAADDPVTGAWEGRFISDLMQGDRAALKMSLRKTDEGKITGWYETRQGGGEIVEGQFDKEKGSITFSGQSERSDLDFSGSLTGDTIKGDVEIVGREFTFEFEIKRTSTTFAATESEKPEQAPARGDRLGDLIPGPRWVSSLEASRHSAGRVYITLDGHRSNDDEPYVFVSENHGKTWSGLRGNLPVNAGSTRVIREDIENENLLFLGCEFSAWVSIDRGKSWTRFGGGLPTVAVHDFAIHPTSGEIVAGTHGRSLWVADISPLRQLDPDALESPVLLLKPNSVVRWNDPRSYGSVGNHSFSGDNPDGNAEIFYYLGERTQNVYLTVEDSRGSLVRSFDGEGSQGLHRIEWDLRRQSADEGGGGPGFRRAAGVGTGQYLVTLSAGGREFRELLEIEADPARPQSDATSEAQFEFDEAWFGSLDDDGGY